MERQWLACWVAIFSLSSMGSICARICYQQRFVACGFTESGSFRSGADYPGSGLLELECGLVSRIDRKNWWLYHGPSPPHPVLLLNLHDWMPMPLTRMPGWFLFQTAPGTTRSFPIPHELPNCIFQHWSVDWSLDFLNCFLNSRANQDERKLLKPRRLLFFLLRSVEFWIKEFRNLICQGVFELIKTLVFVPKNEDPGLQTKLCILLLAFCFWNSGNPWLSGLTLGYFQKQQTMLTRSTEFFTYPYLWFLCTCGDYVHG